MNSLNRSKNKHEEEKMSMMQETIKMIEENKEFLIKKGRNGKSRGSV